MKKTVTGILFLSVVTIVWYFTWQSKNREFKNNLPDEQKPGSQQISVALTADVALKPLKAIPLKEENNFDLNETYQKDLIELYAHIFDSLNLLNLTPSQIESTTLITLDAATIIQVHRFHTSVAAPEQDKREKAIMMLGLSLKDQTQKEYFYEEYLLRDKLWRNQMKNLHLLLMKEPQNRFLNEAFLCLIKPADTETILDYMQDVQFLDRTPGAEYFHTNPQVMDRFHISILNALIDKVDDYHWWAAYPERDAEQELLDIIESRK